MRRRHRQSPDLEVSAVAVPRPRRVAWRWAGQDRWQGALVVAAVLNLVFSALADIQRFAVRLGLTALAGGILMGTGMVIGRVMRRDQRRRTQRWADRPGWRRVTIDTARRWPWEALAAWPADGDRDSAGDRPHVEVKFAVAGVVDGYPVTVGGLQWNHGAIGGLSRRGRGWGMFAIVVLDEPRPTMAIWPHPRVAGRSAKGRFADRFAIVADGVPDVFANHALREAHVAGEVPPWALVGHELLGIEENVPWPPHPDIAFTLARGLIRVAGLLDNAAREDGVTEVGG